MNNSDKKPKCRYRGLTGNFKIRTFSYCEKSYVRSGPRSLWYMPHAEKENSDENFRCLADVMGLAKARGVSPNRNLEWSPIGGWFCTASCSQPHTKCISLSFLLDLASAEREGSRRLGIPGPAYQQRPGLCPGEVTQVPQPAAAKSDHLEQRQP